MFLLITKLLLLLWLLFGKNNSLISPCIYAIFRPNPVLLFYFALNFFVEFISINHNFSRNIFLNAPNIYVVIKTIFFLRRNVAIALNS